MIWSYNYEKGWEPKYKLEGIPHVDERLDGESVAEYADRIGYGEFPVISSCNEHVLLAVWESPAKKYLVQFEIDELEKIVFADSFPSMLHLLNVMQPIITCFQVMESKCS